jgi:hypothetical protein
MEIKILNLLQQELKALNAKKIWFIDSKKGETEILSLHEDQIYSTNANVKITQENEEEIEIQNTSSILIIVKNNAVNLVL